MPGNARVCRISKYGDFSPIWYNLWCCGCLWSGLSTFIQILINILWLRVLWGGLCHIFEHKAKINFFLFFFQKCFQRTSGQHISSPWREEWRLDAVLYLFCYSIPRNTGFSWCTRCRILCHVDWVCFLSSIHFLATPILHEGIHCKVEKI